MLLLITTFGIHFFPLALVQQADKNDSPLLNLQNRGEGCKPAIEHVHGVNKVPETLAQPLLGDVDRTGVSSRADVLH